MSENQKAWIDEANYETLLDRWRNAPCGDLMFQGDTGEYFKRVMFEKRDALSVADRVSASKSVGWAGGFR